MRLIPETLRRLIRERALGLAMAAEPRAEPMRAWARGRLLRAALVLTRSA